MNAVITVIRPEGERILAEICRRLDLPVAVGMHARGTADKSVLDFLGLESREKRAMLIVANGEKTKELIEEERRRLYLDVPGNGIAIVLDLKSVGGGSTLDYLSGGKPHKKAKPVFGAGFELIVAIANEGFNEDVMDAARSAGARGGTILHGKGTGSEAAKKFFKVSIAAEKELILIVAKTEEKAAIMRAILERAGAGTPAAAIVFSLPVSAIAGFSPQTADE